MSSTNLGSVLMFDSCVLGTCSILRSMCVSFFHLMGGVLLLKYIYDDSFFRGFGQKFFSSWPQYAIRRTGILSQIASFERRLRGAAQTPLALPFPFRTST